MLWISRSVALVSVVDLDLGVVASEHRCLMMLQLLLLRVPLFGRELVSWFPGLVVDEERLRLHLRRLVYVPLEDEIHVACCQRLG